jgi:hypothetical protein
VATTALIIRRDSVGRTVTGQSGALEVVAPDATLSTIYQPGVGATTTTMLGLPDMTIRSSSVWDALWNARYDPAGDLLAIEPIDQAAADVMPTPEQFGCTSEECRGMYNYVVWNEIAHTLGFNDVRAMQAANPAIDFSTPPREGDVLQTAYSDAVVPPTSTTMTTIEGIAISVAPSILLSDGGGPSGPWMTHLCEVRSVRRSRRCQSKRLVTADPIRVLSYQTLGIEGRGRGGGVRARSRHLAPRPSPARHRRRYRHCASAALACRCRRPARAHADAPR